MTLSGLNESLHVMISHGCSSVELLNRALSAMASKPNKETPWVVQPEPLIRNPLTLRYLHSMRSMQPRVLIDEHAHILRRFFTVVSWRYSRAFLTPVKIVYFVTSSKT